MPVVSIAGVISRLLATGDPRTIPTRNWAQLLLLNPFLSSQSPLVLQRSTALRRSSCNSLPFPQSLFPRQRVTAMCRGPPTRRLCSAPAAAFPLGLLHPKLPVYCNLLQPIIPAKGSWTPFAGGFFSSSKHPSLKSIGELRLFRSALSECVRVTSLISPSPVPLPRWTGSWWDPQLSVLQMENLKTIPAAAFELIIFHEVQSHAFRAVASLFKPGSKPSSATKLFSRQRNHRQQLLQQQGWA